MAQAQSTSLRGVPDVSLLFQDLLSPPTTLLPATTPRLITYHLSTLPLASVPTLLPQLIHYILISPSLWRGQALLPHEPIAYDHALDIFRAVRDGVVFRAGEIARELDGTGWRARRRYSVFVDEMCQGMQAAEGGHPVLRLLMSSAMLSGLQGIKARREKLFVGGKALIGRAETEVLNAWDGYFAVHPVGRNATLSGSNTDPLPSWLASETLPLFSVEALKLGPVSSLLPYLTSSYTSVFSRGTLFSSLASDLSRNGTDQLHWTSPSASHTLLSSTTTSPLFAALGPLSRAIGRTIEASSISALPPLTLALERLTSRIRDDWASTRWSDLTSDSALSPESRDPTLPWQILKSLLFSLVLIQSSLLVVLSPEHAASPTMLERDLAAQGIKVLGNTYFVTLKFGVDGFGAWKGVWEGLLQVVRHDEESVAKLLRNLEPKNIGILHHREVGRSGTTFYLNAAEQLMKQLPPDYVKGTLLTCCKPYLTDAQHRETFESAHSVLLALFVTQKDPAIPLAPWYTDLLLKSYPSMMSTSQLRLAFSAMMHCVSTTDDALAWYCLNELIKAIQALPTSAVVSTSIASYPPSAGSTFFSTSSPSSPALKRDEISSTTNLTDIPSSTLSPLEEDVLTLPRGHLLLVLIDQTASVNLVLLMELLDHIWELVRAEPEGGRGREALVKVVFAALGEGLDGTKRDEGVRYWLEKGEELL